MSLFSCALIAAVYFLWRLVRSIEKKMDETDGQTWEEVVPFFLAIAERKGYTRDEYVRYLLDKGAILPQTVCYELDLLPEKEKP